jgi:hypothetical protein
MYFVLISMKQSFRLLGAVALTAILLVPSLVAQLVVPQPSPSSTLKQRVSITDVTVEYSRPSLKGRTAFGDLVPYGKLWRTAANQPTKITFSNDVTIGGTRLTAGTYTLFSIPDKKEWTVIFNKNSALRQWTDYKQEEDAVRVKVKSSSLPSKVETFAIDITEIELHQAHLEIAWEKTSVKVPIQFNDKEKIVADAKEKATAAGSEADATKSANTYFQAASYFYEAGLDAAQALEWVNASIAKRNEAFWVHHLKAKILVRLKKNAEALACATLSIEQAEKAKNDDYVALNKKLIAGLKK